MYYGYNISTIYGEVPAYTDEYNVPLDLPPLQPIFLNSPSTSFVTDGATVICSPVINSVGQILTSVDEVSPNQALRVGTVLPNGFVLGEPTLITRPPKNAIVAQIQVEGALWMVYIIALAIIITLFTLIVTDYWAQRNETRYQEHKLDILAQAMEVTSDTSVDLNADGVNDVRTIVYGNGATVQVALSDYGVTVLGDTSKVVNKGISLDDLLKSDIPWDLIIIGIVAITGIVLIVPMLSRTLGSRGPQTYYAPGTGYVVAGRQGTSFRSDE